MFAKKRWWIITIIACAVFWWSTYEVASYCYGLIKVITK